MIDRNGNETTLTYSGGAEKITDPAGRKITLAYNGEGLVAKDPMGHTVKYTYESGAGERYGAGGIERAMAVQIQRFA